MVCTRSTFEELEKLKTQRFDYSLVLDEVPDFSQMEMGSEQVVKLKNKTVGETEKLMFRVTHNRTFPTGQRAVYGLVETEDGRTVQIQFDVYKRHKEYSRIVAFLRPRPLRRLSPSV